MNRQQRQNRHQSVRDWRPGSRPPGGLAWVKRAIRNIGRGRVRPTSRRVRVWDGRGMVTVELALGVLSVAVLTAMLGWIIHLGIVQVQCLDTATQVARQIARGDQHAAERAIQAAPARVRVDIRRTNGDVLAVARADVDFFGAGSVGLLAEARYPLEPGVK